jgi:hypothetical protein
MKQNPQMPDFDTQTPQEPNEPNRLRTLLSAHKHRILSIANELRTLMLANWLRTALIGVGSFFFVMVVVPGGLLIYQSSGVSDRVGKHIPDIRLPDIQAVRQDDWPDIVTCEEEELRESGECIAPSSVDDSVVCEAKFRDLVEDQNYHCRKGPIDSDAPYRYAGPTVTCDAWMLGKTDECFAPDSNDDYKSEYNDGYVVCDADNRYGVDSETTPCRKPLVARGGWG